ncbi:MAG TPA: hypothetical protein VJ022_07735 [Anaerolineales bacterium]|nr:hypothetical protein [Anaerolineales bacterium]
MSNIIGFLESIEKLAYKILLWVILIPKTIIQITINPGWAPEYIKGELKQEKSPFDEYISPIVLLLIVALIPAMVINFLPVFGTTISSPAETEATTNHFLWFDAETSFKSTSPRMRYTSSWYVQEVTTDELGNNVYTEIYRENHDNNNWYIEDVNNNTTRETFYYEFKPGEYDVNVYVEKIDTEKNNIPVESYFSYLRVYVSENPEEQIYISNFSSKPKSKEGDKKGFEKLTDQIKKETTIFLALGLLIPPLLFALATKLFTSEAITENALRESFYAQCYYFTPINLAFWASYYADYFFTPDIFGYKTYSAASAILYLPLLLAVVWFIGIEIQAVSRERQTRGWISFLIVLICIVIVGVSISLVTSFSNIKDNLRVTSIWIYPVATGVLLLGFAISWYKRMKAENRKIRLGEIILISALLIIITLFVIAFAFGEKISSSIPIEETGLDTDVAVVTASPEIQESPPATEPPTQTLPTDTPLSDAQPFYTEEFDTNNDNWTYFVVDGNTNRIADEDNPGLSVFTGNGALTFDLNDNNLWTYSTYDPFEYEDVRIDMRVTNRGVNTNDVSLICRYTDTGWYEFNIGNDGLYTILFAKVDSSDNVSYKTIFEGGSTAIKSGKGTNEYTAICSGRTLSLYINGKETRVITETNYNLTSGKIGISVSSFDVLPVAIDVDWVMISEP